MNVVSCVSGKRKSLVLGGGFIRIITGTFHRLDGDRAGLCPLVGNTSFPLVGRCFDHDEAISSRILPPPFAGSSLFSGYSCFYEAESIHLACLLYVRRLHRPSRTGR